MTTKMIEQHLTKNNSYFKWSAERLADKYGCSTRTISNIIKKLKTVKDNYLRSLQN